MLSLPGPWVRSLVGELRLPRKPHGTVRKNKNKKTKKLITLKNRKHQAQMVSLVNSTKYLKKKLYQCLSEDRSRGNIS